MTNPLKHSCARSRLEIIYLTPFLRTARKAIPFLIRIIVFGLNMPLLFLNRKIKPNTKHGWKDLKKAGANGEQTLIKNIPIFPKAHIIFMYAQKMFFRI